MKVCVCPGGGEAGAGGAGVRQPPGRVTLRGGEGAGEEEEKEEAELINKRKGGRAFYSAELAAQVRPPLAGDAGESGPAARRSCCVLPWGSFTVSRTYNKTNLSDRSVLAALCRCMACILFAHQAVLGGPEKGGTSGHRSTVPTASVQPGELGHPLFGVPLGAMCLKTICYPGPGKVKTCLGHRV